MSWANPITIQYNGIHTTLTAGVIEYHAMYLHVEQIPVARTLFSSQTATPAPTRAHSIQSNITTSSTQTATPAPTWIHTNQSNVTTSTTHYEPLIASVRAGALITGAWLDVGLYAFLFIFLGPHII
jgi:hypothetical protein